MQKDPFELLGVSQSVTQSELYDAYRNKREQYLDKRFAPGEEGAEACAKLDEIESAYREAESILKERVIISDLPHDFKEIEDMIKAGRVSEAQEALDRISIRSAEWHFLQSIIYYKKGWTEDSLAQLKEAVDQDPTNDKYKDAYEKMNKRKEAEQKNKSHRTSFYDNMEGDDGRTYRNSTVDNDAGNNRRGCTPCDVCAGLYCADCCCECCGGDLISCC